MKQLLFKPCEKRMANILGSRRGDGYIDVVVAVLVSMMLIVLSLNVFSFFTLHQDLDYFAKEMVEAACADGQTGSEAVRRAEELSEDLGISPVYVWSAEYMTPASAHRVQLGDSMSIQVQYTSYVQGLGIFRIPVTMTVTHSGLSERYWK